MEIAIYYGSTDGNTARVAALIATRIERQIQASDVDSGDSAKRSIKIALVDIGDDHIDDAEEYDLLLFGIPTWNHGQLQADWEEAIDDLDSLCLQGIPAAIFGLGDQIGYPATFADAVYFLADRLRARGATLIGRWPLTGYDFTGSWAVEDKMFLGLILDEVNQPTLTEQRIARWVDIVIAEAGTLDRSA